MTVGMQKLFRLTHCFFIFNRIAGFKDCESIQPQPSINYGKI